MWFALSYLIQVDWEAVDARERSKRKFAHHRGEGKQCGANHSGQILGRITVRKVLHQPLPRLYAASVRTVVLIARRLLSMGRYTNGNEIITYAQTSNGGVLTMLKGSLLSIGTSPSKSTVMRGLDDPYTSSRPSAMIMAGTA